MTGASIRRRHDRHLHDRGTCRVGRHRRGHRKLSRLLERRAGQGAGVNFAFIKLNQGTGYVNPYANCQLDAARSAGIREGAYDFASPQTSTPEAEADKFVSEARARGMIGRAIPVLDWEPSAPGGYWGKQTGGRSGGSTA